MRLWPLMLVYFMFAVALYFAACEWKQWPDSPHRPLDWNDLSDRLI